jgi:hypothetical protein
MSGGVLLDVRHMPPHFLLPERICCTKCFMHSAHMHLSILSRVGVGVEVLDSPCTRTVNARVARRGRHAFNHLPFHQHRSNGGEQLRTKSRASSKWPRGRPVKQKQSKAPVAVATEPEAEIVPEQPRSRTGRAVRRPRFFDDI